MDNTYINPNHFSGNDSEKINQAVQVAAACGKIVRVPAREPDAAEERTYWLLDSAILLPANTTLLLENCKLKLSNQCRDNFIRSANAGYGISDIRELENIHVKGIGTVLLEGADDPRSTGDRSKVLGERAYGTDAGKSGELQHGDWRNVGVLFASVKNFSISGLTIKDSHCWGISMEYCSDGVIRDIVFDSKGVMNINGTEEQTPNQDGLDIRRGCRNLLVENISGKTGDDLVAVTAILSHREMTKTFEATEISQIPDDPRENDVYNIIIRNVRGYSAGNHQIVRLLNASGVRLRNILIDGVVDCSPVDGLKNIATIRIGDNVAAWGGIAPVGDAAHIQICNVFSRSKRSILIAGSIADSIISNVINANSETPTVQCDSGWEYVLNLHLSNLMPDTTNRR
ncbi:MAG: hypothetical protein IJZ19_12335 [Lentisphaeria bacterium]|nr:hypothetical protein [Lentisphaeria bacterium]